MTENKPPTPTFKLPNEPVTPIVPIPQAQQQDLSIEQALGLASQYQQEGRLQEAEHLLNQILQVQPENAGALHTLGIVAHMAGKTPIGIELIERAIKSDGNIALFHSNVGEMHRLMKNLGAAISHGKKAVKLEPSSVSAHSNLGIAYYDNKELDKAEACQKKALSLNPNFVPSLNNMGSILRDRKDKKGAVEYYLKVLDVDPNYIESLNNVGATLVQMEKPEAAMVHLDKALTLNNNYADAHCNKGFALKALGHEDQAFLFFQNALNLRPEYVEAMIGVAQIYLDVDELDKAEEVIKNALKIEHDNTEALSVLGTVYFSQGKTDKAEKEFKKAIKQDESITSALLGVGNIYVERGKFDEAEKVFLEALKNCEDVGDDKSNALFGLAQLRKVKEGDDIVPQIEELAQSLDTMVGNKAMYSNFAIGKVYDDLKQPEKSFPHFIEGCRLKREKIKYDFESDLNNFKIVKEIFTKDFIDKHRGHGSSSKTPIFVLGMPRSGTTLTEQIIASHPDVFGAGELRELSDIVSSNDVMGELPFPQNLQNLTADRIDDIGIQYVSALKKHAPNSKRITDKMPANYFHIGLIHLALPNAKIVHLQRHPLDNCISCFTRLFARHQDYSYDLAELGRFYREYKDLMAHWERVLPKGTFYNLRYENMVADIETQAKALINYCELEWNDACLEFYKHKRNIRTASVTQVRQPIYKSSVARWKQYEEFLPPLIDSLGAALDGEEM